MYEPERGGGPAVDPLLYSLELALAAFWEVHVLVQCGTVPVAKSYPLPSQFTYMVCMNPFFSPPVCNEILIVGPSNSRPLDSY